MKERAKAANNAASLTAALAVERRVNAIGHAYFRIHPKGQGVVCKRPEGLPPLTFVEVGRGHRESQTMQDEAIR